MISKIYLQPIFAKLLFCNLSDVKKIIFFGNFVHSPVKIIKLAINANCEVNGRHLGGFPAVVKVIINLTNRK